MNPLAQVRLLQERGDLDGFIFQPSSDKDWVVRMEDSQDRAAQVCIFEAARAMMALLDTYPIDTILPKWKAHEDGKLWMSFEIWKSNGDKDRFNLPGGVYTMTWTDEVDQSATWQEAFIALDDTCQPSLARCAKQLNDAFPHPMNLTQLAAASREHAGEVEALWQAVALQHDTPQAKASTSPRRP